MPDMVVCAELREAERRSGAAFPPSVEGNAGPLHFGSPSAEYAAATNAAALFDISDRDVIEVAGSDRVKFLNNFCTNDVMRLSAGQGCEAFFANVKGRVLGHVWIDACEQSLWLEAGAGSAARLVPHLQRYIINEDVTIAPRSAEWGELLALGPDAGGILARLGLNVDPLAPLEHFTAELNRLPLRVRRFDVGPRAGFALVAPRGRLAELWTRLGREGIRPAGSDVWNALRIEAGLPAYGVDITEDNLAQEVGRTESAISFTKGCYLGQEPIARLDALGHVNRELRSLRLTGKAIPPSGSSVFADAAATQPAGAVTSAAFSFGMRAPVAMALLRSASARTGMVVFVEIGGARVSATVFWAPSGAGK